MPPEQSLEDDDVARRPKRKLNFSDFRFGISAVDFHVRILARESCCNISWVCIDPESLGG